MKPLGRFLWHWLPPLVWMGLIFALSAQSTLLGLPDNVAWWYDVLDKMLKKGAHMFVYGVLAWLFLRALRLHCDRWAILRLVSVGLAVAYGLTDEYHQTSVPGREGKLLDVMVDGAGACGAMLLNWWLARRRMSRRPNPRAQQPLAR